MGSQGQTPAGPGTPNDGAGEVGKRTHRGVDWLFIGEDGRLRTGCSLILFVFLFRVLMFFFEAVAVVLSPSFARNEFSTGSAFASELVLVLALLSSVALVGLFERRKIRDFNLSGPNRGVNFLTGGLAGFVALSMLLAALAFGRWIRFGPVSLTGVEIPKYALLWACVFFLVGCFEEGMFRCYLQFTFTRSINFWWALAFVTFICVDLLLRSKGAVGLVAFIWMQPMEAIRGNGMWGLIAVGSLGLLPCLGLYLAKAENASFWYASWATSVLFGYIHVGNNGENWIGIFAAAAIGFVFCVSIWVTGSAWWAIGCHAGWDWGETYFYGTADSGMVAPRHYLSTKPFGNAFWSGGADGPEGSVLVLGVILLLLVYLLIAYGLKGRLIAPNSASSVSN